MSQHLCVCLHNQFSVCAETYETLVNHAGIDHDITIDAKQITESNEDDNFLVSQKYDRRSAVFRRKNCDHIYKQIKIRIIAQIKFQSFSRAIERNMKEDNLKTSCYKGRNQEV